MGEQILNDRELLEMAAKAARIELAWSHLEDVSPRRRPDYEIWNPLTSDGDEARLEAALGLWVRWYPGMVLVDPEVFGHITAVACAEYYDQHNGDKQAARRRAGTRAAAAIGAAK